jgi:hypothetical protein
MSDPPECPDVLDINTLLRNANRREAPRQRAPQLELSSPVGYSEAWETPADEAEAAGAEEQEEASGLNKMIIRNVGPEESWRRGTGVWRAPALPRTGVRPRTASGGGRDLQMVEGDRFPRDWGISGTRARGGWDSPIISILLHSAVTDHPGGIPEAVGVPGQWSETNQRDGKRKL